MATKLQHQLLSTRNSLKQKEKELNLEQLKNNDQLRIKSYRPVNLNYIKVDDICRNLEITKTDYKIYLIDVRDIMKYYNTPINVPFIKQDPVLIGRIINRFNNRNPGAKVGYNNWLLKELIKKNIQHQRDYQKRKKPSGSGSNISSDSNISSGSNSSGNNTSSNSSSSHINSNSNNRNSDNNIVDDYDDDDGNISDYNKGICYVDDDQDHEEDVDIDDGDNQDDVARRNQIKNGKRKESAKEDDQDEDFAKRNQVKKGKGKESTKRKSKKKI